MDIAAALGLSPSDIQGLSPATLEQLVQLLDQKSDDRTIALYPISSIVYLAVLYFHAKLTSYLFHRFSSVYRRMTSTHQRTSVIYVLNIIHTTVVLILQLIASPALAKEYTVEGTKLIRIAATIVSLLYLFELIYRESMRLQMIVHHFATLFAICLVAGTLADSHHPTLVVTALCWLYQASTEQLSFLALLGYRLHYPPKRVAALLKFAAIQNMIPKLGFAIYLLVWWGKEQSHNTTHKIDIFFSVIFMICLAVLIVVQFYGSYVLWVVAVGISKKADRSNNRVPNLEGGGEKDLENEHRTRKPEATEQDHSDISDSPDDIRMAEQDSTAVNTPSSEFEQSKFMLAYLPKTAF